MREYRLTHQISADAHLALLQDFGWTLDEFEVIFVQRRLRSNTSSTPITKPNMLHLFFIIIIFLDGTSIDDQGFAIL